MSLRIEHLRVRALRCFEGIDVEPGPGTNVFIGDNGSGKTSLLESLYLLSRGASFRQTVGRSLIRDGADALSIHAHLASPSPARMLALLRDHEQTRCKIDGSASRGMSEMSRACPTLILEPGSHRLLEDGPNNRRKVLDWVVFHVEHRYLDQWRNFMRALRQRNQALRMRNANALHSWTEALVQAANAVDAARRRVADELLDSVRALGAEHFPEFGELSLAYRRGWSSTDDLAEIYARQLDTDRERGFTHAGPHRAELVFRVSGHPAREFLSRGQQKLLLLTIALAQLDLIAGHSGRMPILLVDDWAAELGIGAREKLWSMISGRDAQVFLTALEAEPELMGAGDARMFHVKHSAVTPVL